MTEVLSMDAAGKNHRCGYAALVGMPNAGKSTLMNHYLKEKISIVTPKPQTTRTTVTTILSADDHQIIFIDTPGFLKPRYRMQEVMVSYITRAVQEADVIVVVVDAAVCRGSIHHIIASFAETVLNRRVVVALNKIDLMKKDELLPLMGQFAAIFPGADIVPVSAMNGDGADDLLAPILAAVPEGPKLFPDDIISNEPERFFVAELIRESVFLGVEDEIPYATAVIIDSYEEKERVTVVGAAILVEKKSQKPILIGKNGQRIKSIGTNARLAIEAFLGKKVYLDLRVTVRKDWRSKDVFLQAAGLLR